MKRILPAKVKNPEAYSTEMRDTIAALNRIIDRFGTEDGFEDYIEQDTIKLTVGKDEAAVFFSPQTWEAAEYFIKYCVCHLIESDELDSFPYYKNMADKYAADLKIERGSFE